MVDQVFQDGEARMKQVITSTTNTFSTIRTGRANPSLLDRIVVNYYNTPTPLNQLASISAPEPRMLLIQPWDKTVIKEIEKAIMASDLGLTPNSDGNVIRIGIPQLTEERRKQLVKVVKKESEDHRIAIRNIRRDMNEEIKTLEKNGEITEDESRRYLDEVQKLTDKYIAEIDRLAEAKEKEILEI
ncbi:MAG TPA: ribosome recycling factor [Firmicutes bacterium]|nr:ribosome recycling factor [Bacillota bacterium]